MNHALKTFLNRRRWNPPPGATHVFRWIPPHELSPGLHDPGDGLWELTALDCFLAGRTDGLAAGISGSSSVPEADLAAFAWDEFGETVTLTGADSLWWVTPAEDEPSGIRRGEAS